MLRRLTVVIQGSGVPPPTKKNFWLWVWELAQHRLTWETNMTWDTTHSYRIKLLLSSLHCYSKSICKISFSVYRTSINPVYSATQRYIRKQKKMDCFTFPKCRANDFNASSAQLSLEKQFLQQKSAGQLFVWNHLNVLSEGIMHNATIMTHWESCYIK